MPSAAESSAYEKGLLTEKRDSLGQPLLKIEALKIEAHKKALPKRIALSSGESFTYDYDREGHVIGASSLHHDVRMRWGASGGRRSDTRDGRGIHRSDAKTASRARCALTEACASTSTSMPPRTRMPLRNHSSPSPSSTTRVRLHRQSLAVCITSFTTPQACRTTSKTTRAKSSGARSIRMRMEPLWSTPRARSTTRCAGLVTTSITTRGFVLPKANQPIAKPLPRLRPAPRPLPRARPAWACGRGESLCVQQEPDGRC